MHCLINVLFVSHVQGLMQLNDTLGCCLAEVVNALVDSGYVETSI